jgi:hypothetical protein
LAFGKRSSFTDAFSNPFLFMNATLSWLVANKNSVAVYQKEDCLTIKKQQSGKAIL